MEDDGIVVEEEVVEEDSAGGVGTLVDEGALVGNGGALVGNGGELVNDAFAISATVDGLLGEPFPRGGVSTNCPAAFGSLVDSLVGRDSASGLFRSERSLRRWTFKSTPSSIKSSSVSTNCKSFQPTLCSERVSTYRERPLVSRKVSNFSVSVSEAIECFFLCVYRTL